MARETICETMRTPPATNCCCRPPDPLQPQLPLSAGETCVGISPRSCGRGQRVLFCEIVKQGCGQHAQVVELPRIYVWIIHSRNSSYKERARLHHVFLCNSEKIFVNLAPISRAPPFTA